jgi:oxaloacetate decarboxylase beta subunit
MNTLLSLTDNLRTFWSYTGFFNAEIGHIIMIVIGLVFIYLAISKEYEPLLLIPIGFGILIGNIPFNEAANLQVGIYEEGSVLNILYQGVVKGWYPPLIFLGIGAMTDFSALIANPKLILIGAAAQFGIFGAYIIALQMGFAPNEAGAIGIIGGADGPTAIFTTSKLAPHLLGAVAISAYSYMALVPVIIPFIAKRLMSEKEMKIHMKKMDKQYPPKHEIKHMKTVKIIFPIVLGVIVAVLVPSSAPLLGMLLFGNLVKEIGSSTSRLADAASGPIMNTATIFLGLTVGATMTSEVFLSFQTLGIIVGGLLAFGVSVAGGIFAVKGYNLFSKKKINPLVGATGLSAVPMASRVANEVALKYDKSNHILQYCMASNVSGVIGSAVAAGVLISFLG